jgi:tetratricopeptide (TPR) repeat protein
MSQLSVRYEIKLAFMVVALVLVSMWTYYGATGNLFVWDSNTYLIKHKDHISDLTLKNLWWMTTSLEFFNWHPLTWFSWAIDYQLYNGLSTWGFHFSNNVFHAINGVIVFFLILTAFGLVVPAGEYFTMRRDNNALVAAFLASLLFVVHPQHVESVAWVAERKDLLCQFFLLLSLLAYVKYVTCNISARAIWYVMTFGLFFLAALSKPMAVTFPAVLLLVDIFPLRRTSLAKPVFSSVHQQTFFGLFVEKIPFFLLSLGLVLTTLLAQESAIGSMAQFPFVARVVNAAHSVVFYLEKFFIPRGLSPHYAYFQIMGTGSATKTLLVFSILLGFTFAALFAWRKQKRAWLIAWVFYLVTLLPVLGLIQVGSQGAADRYAYFTTLPLYFLVAGAIYLALQKGSNFRKAIPLLTVVTVILLFMIQTRQQIRVWENEFSLWTHVIKLDSNNKFAHSNLGILYKNSAEFENAALEFEAAGEGVSVPSSTLGWRAVTYMHLGRYKESIDYLVKLGMAAEIKPGLKVDSNCIQYNIGWNYAQLKMYQESKDLFSRIAPDSNIGADASEWFKALKNVNKQGDETMLNQELPGICENLIPSRALKQGVR